MFVVGFPLLVIPFALYNMVAFLLPGVSWTSDIARFDMMSGAEWTVTASDILIAASVLLLFGEMLKSTRLSKRTIVDHLLSAVLFIAMLAEFLLVKQVATGTFFLLLMISFVDVAGGLTIRTARRDATGERAEKASQS